MELDLEQIYPWNGLVGAEGGSSGRFVLCSEAPGAWSGEFAFTTLLAQTLKGGNSGCGSCILVCANRGRSHFEGALRKKVACHGTDCAVSSRL